MKLGLELGYSGARMTLPMELILEAERLGFDSAWFSEAWGSDAVTPAAWVLAQTNRIHVGTAIMQIPARTPACTAMTAMTLQQLSGDRFRLGLGPSGPQVVEGWHGVPYGRPITRTREYVSIVRKILARDVPLTFEGREYQIPYQGPDATRLGKPLRSIIHGNPDLQIYTAAITPNGVRCAGEVANGFFPVWMNPDRFDLFADQLNEGFARTGDNKSLREFDVAPFVFVVLGDDLEQCYRPVKATLALYIGGMGARGKNFYNDYARRLGYEQAAAEIQELYLAGHRRQAAAKVPDQMVDDVALVGPAARIKEHLQRWQTAGAKGHVGSMLVQGASVEALRVLAEEVL